MKRIFLLMLALLCMAGCSSNSAKSTKLAVAVSFYPIAEFTRAVGQDLIDLQILVPDGVEPHDWDPSPRDLTRLGRARVFIYNGIVESWAEPALDTLSERKLLSLEAGKDLYTINGHPDPHVWVSPKKAILETERITQLLCEADSKNAASYKENSKKYIAELQKLDISLKDVVKKSKRKAFVTAHAAFGHLAADYSLKQLAIAGISPEAEPNPKDLQKLIKLIKEENIKYVFMETLATPKLTEVISTEAGAKILVLDPIEGLDEEGRKENLTYLKLMENNIKNLAIALNE